MAEQWSVVTSKIDYPGWYRTFRAFVAGVMIGSSLVALLYELKVPPANNVIWQQVFLPMLLGTLPGLVLGVFEIFFLIRRHRTLVREMGRGINPND